MLGTQWAINYNPELVPRQAGYPMALPLPEEVITPFITDDLGAHDGRCLRDVHQAWRSVVRKGPEWGPQSCGASSSYKAWLQDRLEQASLTFEDP
ncbi:hypothetical protein CR513_12193, partial [Mucuna pruriens]